MREVSQSVAVHSSDVDPIYTREFKLKMLESMIANAQGKSHSLMVPLAQQAKLNLNRFAPLSRVATEELELGPESQSKAKYKKESLPILETDRQTIWLHDSEEDYHIQRQNPPP